MVEEYVSVDDALAGDPSNSGANSSLSQHQVPLNSSTNFFEQMNSFAVPESTDDGGTEPVRSTERAGIMCTYFIIINIKD